MKQNRIARTYLLDPELLRQLEAWCEAQAAAPSRTAVVEAALREFLHRHKRVAR